MNGRFVTLLWLTHSGHAQLTLCQPHNVQAMAKCAALNVRAVSWVEKLPTRGAIIGRSCSCENNQSL